MVMQHIIGSYKKGGGLVPGEISGNRVIHGVANKMQVGCADEFEAFNCFYRVTDEEVARGKRELKAALFGGSGSADAKCAELGKQMLAYGRGISPAEMVVRIDAIDAEEVKRVAWKYLNDNEVAASALGPLHGMPQYYDLRRATCMHRY